MAGSTPVPGAAGGRELPRVEEVMTCGAVLRFAQSRANVRKEAIAVVWSVEDDDVEGEHYHTATAGELATYYFGIAPNAILAWLDPERKGPPDYLTNAELAEIGWKVADTSTN